MTNPYEHLDEEVERECAEIIATQPVERRSRGGGGGRPSLAPQFEQLDANQRSAIRGAVKRGGDAEIGRQARKYGVKRATVLLVLGR